jgi:hypothetical protein
MRDYNHQRKPDSACGVALGLAIKRVISPLAFFPASSHKGKKLLPETCKLSRSGWAASLDQRICIAGKVKKLSGEPGN